MKDINGILGKLKEKNILLVGDAILDCSVVGCATHLSAEAPIPVFKETERTYRAGGVANVACNLIAARQNVRLCSVVGDDAEGGILRGLLQKSGTDISCLLTDESRKTTLKTRYFTQADAQVFRSDNEDTAELSEEKEDAVFAGVENAADWCDLIVISDYAKGVVTYSLVKKIVALAKTKNKKIVVDPKTADYAKYYGCHVIKPNLKEFSAMVKGRKDGVDVSLESQKICLRNDTETLIVTLGKEGMLSTGKDGESHQVKGIKTETKDVCGAGDTALAYIAVGIACGLSMRETLELANFAAAKKLTKQGASAVSTEELYTFNGKLVARGEISGLRARLKGQTVAFTNGCFDLLHVGHIESLKAAKACADKLVVGVNTDASVKRLKGNARPVQPLEERIAVLSALAFVDYVIPFDEDTPYEIIQELVPNVLVKGAEYKDVGVVGADFVEANGGYVKYVEMVKGVSTTEIIRKMYDTEE